MGYYFAVVPYGYDDELYHFGIKGMKWGVRRFRNKDGSYTNAGRRRYGLGKPRKQITISKEHLLESTDPDEIYRFRKYYTTQELQGRLNRLNAEENLYKKTKKAKRRETAKRIALGSLKTAAVAGPTALSAYALWKRHKNPNWVPKSWILTERDKANRTMFGYAAEIGGAAINNFGGKKKK